MAKFYNRSKETIEKDGEREENDYYPTPPWATEELLKKEEFIGEIWEPACGGGHMAEVLKDHGFDVYSTDLINRGYGDEFNSFFDIERKTDNIITNPPYKIALEFVEHALKQSDKKVAMFLRLQFLESKKRHQFFQNNPPKKVYVFSERVGLYKNEVKENISSSVAYAWFIWEKGFEGSPTIDWILRGEDNQTNRPTAKKTICQTTGKRGKD